MTREQLLIDTRGNYRRDIGRDEGEGTVRRHRFYLGKEVDEAARRVVLLEEVWAAAEKMWRSWRDRHGQRGPAVWDEATLPVAMAVARGEQEAEVGLPAWLRERLGRAGKESPGGRRLKNAGQASQAEADDEIRRYVLDLRRHLPFVRIRLADPAPEDRARARLLRESAALLEQGRLLLEQAGERMMTRPEEALHAELNLAADCGVVALHFTEDGIRIWGLYPWLSRVPGGTARGTVRRGRKAFGVYSADSPAVGPRPPATEGSVDSGAVALRPATVPWSEVTLWLAGRELKAEDSVDPPTVASRPLNPYPKAAAACSVDSGVAAIRPPAKRQKDRPPPTT